jgi:hypothetical protein
LKNDRPHHSLQWPPQRARSPSNKKKLRHRQHQRVPQRSLPNSPFNPPPYLTLVPLTKSTQSTLITRLHTDLLSIRQAYLSTAHPRKTHLHLRTRSSTQYLTDRDREEIDANAKSTLRDLNASIRALAEAERLRAETAKALLKKKFAPRFGVAWASGGGGEAKKSPAWVAEEDAAGQMAAHREAVLWFLRQRLGEVGRTQAGMMETRLTREMEKNRSVLAKARGGLVGVDGFPGMGVEGGLGSSAGVGKSAGGVSADREKEGRPQFDLTEEQVQMFEKGNQDMLKHYESTLDKVRLVQIPPCYSRVKKDDGLTGLLQDG